MPPLVRAAPGLAERGGNRLPAGLRTFLSSLTSGITLLGRATFLRREALRVFLRKTFDIGANAMLIGVLWWVVTALGTYIDRLTPGWADFRALSFIVAGVLVLPSTLVILRRIRELLALSLEVLARSAPAFQSQPLRRGMANGLFLLAVLLLALVALPVLSRQLSGYGLFLTAGFLGLVGVAAILFWRSVSGLQTRMERTVKEALLLAPPREAPKVRSMERVLEGFRQSQTIDILEVGPGSPSAGKTISDLKLRTRAGVTIVSVERGAEVVLNPPLTQTLEAGDLLVVLGTAEERARAQDILNGKAPEEPA
jgi:hypothetical protein